MDRSRHHLVSVNLPLPPSVNSAFASRFGSHRTAKSASYRFWLATVFDEVNANGLPPALHVDLHYGLWLDLPRKMRGDVDNRTKLISDVMTENGGLGIVRDDKLMKANYACYIDGLAPDRCIATVVTFKNWPDYMTVRIG